MVSASLCSRSARTRLASIGTSALISLAVADCGGEPAPARQPVINEDAPGADLATRVSAHYTARDLIVTGAWTWEPSGPAGTAFVLVEIQSTLEGLVQARADLWAVTDTSEVRLGRSDVMSAAAGFGAFAFEDLTGDGLPDLLGSVSDSAGTTFPVFLPGARGSMGDELESAAPGWLFAAEGDSLPFAARSGTGAFCYLGLWAEEPAPDGAAGGWRFLRLEQGGRLGPPRQVPPSCGTTLGVEPEGTSP